MNTSQYVTDLAGRLSRLLELTLLFPCLFIYTSRVARRVCMRGAKSKVSFSEHWQDPTSISSSNPKLNNFPDVPSSRVKKHDKQQTNCIIKNTLELIHITNIIPLGCSRSVISLCSLPKRGEVCSQSAHGAEIHIPALNARACFPKLASLFGELAAAQ